MCLSCTADARCSGRSPESELAQRQAVVLLSLSAALQEVAVWQTDKWLCVDRCLFEDTAYEEQCFPGTLRVALCQVLDFFTLLGVITK